MNEFKVHDVQTAPAGSKDRLEGIARAFGFLPNLAGVLAESPAALEGYFTLGDIFGRSDFNATEKQVVLLATSAE